MKWSQLSEAVYAAKSDIVQINAEDVLFLKKQVELSKEKRVRICAHQQAGNNLHEMVIAIQKGSYIRPHKHINKSESFHIIEGMLDVVIFDDSGNIIEIIQMGDFRSGKCFFYRLTCAYFHTLVLKTDLVVFHETTNGPFQKNDTVIAPWSPAQEKLIEVSHFLQELILRIDSYQIS